MSSDPRISYDTLISNAVANFRTNTRHLYPERVEEDFIKLVKLFIPYYLAGKEGNTIDIIKVFIGIKPICSVFFTEYDDLQMSYYQNSLFKDTIDMSDTLFGRPLTDEDEEVCRDYERINKLQRILFMMCQMYGLVMLEAHDDDTYNVVICWKNNIVDALIFNDRVRGIIKLPKTDTYLNRIIFNTFQSILLGYDLESTASYIIEQLPEVSPDEIREIWDDSLIFINKLRKKYSKNIPTLL